MSYILFLDDERSVDMVDQSSWPVDLPVRIARSSTEAIQIVEQYGMPVFCAFDHDLGGDDTTMRFLRFLSSIVEDQNDLPDFAVHSANPVGAMNIVAFMTSWRRSFSL